MRMPGSRHALEMKHAIDQRHIHGRLGLAALAERSGMSLMSPGENALQLGRIIAKADMSKPIGVAISAHLLLPPFAAGPLPCASPQAA